ncbi:ABC transporter family protein [Mycolicibacterium hassiacum DSM 44199]|uniref:ABC-type quaternary amine transporter n=1 Tax=Mycolicibacterium hassiacum (strain DSM 44199 / CIP 105218 / JCM 12690 / 3849) TaxID=1122247 RepID=K5B8C7_MYCHD|nr:ATP-binding cassette domain-containing protein [Mycolicibacterium hassiacum]EKF23468.1 ABC transporter family protein [Mycolicibacterium hassiacum DSM 44199]MDA4084711.1 ABC transporter [Mycolicibacterium hassiacum DSM 44199]VCT89932.1 Osmoprotectant import ATP-binding protein OsmV [Mycolicibacterium hassiacum DSM 44199]
MTTRSTTETQTSGERIVLDHVSKIYPGATEPAVEDTSLGIPAGEIVVFVGPSGCGKTTMMRMINRLSEPTSGRILIGDRDALSIKPTELRRSIGYAIQQAGLFPHMTIRQNVGLVPGLLGWKRARIDERVDELLDMVGLDPARYADRYPRQLSGGQQQRVGVARALAADPPVLLMDEPFGAVDPITRSALQDELLGLQAELHKTIVFVTHDFGEAVKLGDRIAVLGPRSKVLQYDTPQTILANPADGTVAGFVGSGASLRQLSLVRIKDIELRSHPAVRVGSSVEEARQTIAGSEFDWVVVTDQRDRPVSWARGARLRHAESLAAASEPLEVVSTLSTLEDALEAILAEQHASAVVVGRGGRYQGVVTLDMLIDTITRLRAQATAGDSGAS